MFAVDYADCRKRAASQFCLLQIPISATSDTIFATGELCAPSACTLDDIEEVKQGWVPPVDQLISEYNITNIKMEMVKVTCGEHVISTLSAGACATVVLLIVLGLLVLAGTAMHALDRRKQAKQTDEDVLQPLAKRGGRRRVGREVVLAFSLYTNLRFLLLPSPARRFTSLEGAPARVERRPAKRGLGSPPYAP